VVGIENLVWPFVLFLALSQVGWLQKFIWSFDFLRCIILLCRKIFAISFLGNTFVKFI